MDTKSNREHVLVCLSASPSNAHVIEAAAKMAAAFDAQFTALYVSTSQAAKLSEEDKVRLRGNIALCEKLGATVSTVYGDDVSFYIAEFARLSRVTKVVLGRSSVKRRFGSKAPLTDRLTAIAPDIEVHIIPDNAIETQYKHARGGFMGRLLPSWKDVLVTVLVLAVATGIGMLFAYLNLTETNIITVYVLSVLVTAVFTQNYICNVVGAFAGVLVFNLLFVEPRFSLRVNDVGTYVTFAITLIASLITGTLAGRLQYTARKSAQSAYRTKVLFDTNRLLQQQTDSEALLATTAGQLVQLMDRDVAVCLLRDGRVETRVFPAGSSADFAGEEQEVGRWLSQPNRELSLQTEHTLYMAVSVPDRVYGAVGVRTDRPLESLEHSIFRSIVGECALALDSVYARRDKEQASLQARQEQLRANMLRAISHDLRTPLTSIAGNADCLLNSYDKLDDATRRSLFSAIYDDSMWLYGLVENLLSVTRLEDGKMRLNFTCELADELVEEALGHLRRRSEDHKLVKDVPDQPLLVRVDTRLILQVFVNLIDNALKYTPPGSEIVVSARQTAGGVRFSVADNGPGVPDDIKDKVFDMFFTGNNAIADSRRSLGLGLALCRSIVASHGGEMTVEDNSPHGAVFSFTLLQGDVNVNE